MHRPLSTSNSIWVPKLRLLRRGWRSSAVRHVSCHPSCSQDDESPSLQVSVQPTQTGRHPQRLSRLPRHPLQTALLEIPHLGFKRSTPPTTLERSRGTYRRHSPRCTRHSSNTYLSNPRTRPLQSLTLHRTSSTPLPLCHRPRLGQLRRIFYHSRPRSWSHPTIRG